MKTAGAMGNAMQMLWNMQRGNQAPHEQGLPGLVLFPNSAPPQSMGQGLPGPLAQPGLGPATTPALTTAPATPTRLLALPAPTTPASCSSTVLVEETPLGQHVGEETGLGKHVAALQEILAQRKVAPMDDEDEGSAVDSPDTKHPAKVQPPATKTPPKKPTKKGVMKRPAAAKSSARSSSGLEYPGTSRAPLVYGNSKVYFGKNRFRLLECIGDRQDVSYSYKVEEPKEVWKVLAKRLKELNP